jgi:hypothetical protein
MTPDGTPVAGAPVCVTERPEVTGGALRVGPTLVTDAAGRFRYTVKRGPSRRVDFVHRVAGGAVSDRVLVRRRAPIRFRGSRRVLRNGESILLKGRLRRGPIPRRGVLVEIQAHRPSGWQTFGKVVRTDRKGRFRFRYRFVRTRGVQAYALRARIPRSREYPYATSTSRPILVRVIG